MLTSEPKGYPYCGYPDLISNDPIPDVNQC
nr:MAG TPA: hypothetical protein [Caudoviricetes sp.]